MARFRSKIGLVRRTLRMVDLGGMPKPKWLDTFSGLEALPNSTFDPGEEARRPRKGQKLVFPEDRYYHDYLARHPEAKMEPVDLSGSDAPTARRFAWAQLDLVNQGMRPGEATKVLEERFAEEAKKASKPATILQIVQQEEETVLLRAMQEHRDNPQVEDAWLADADDDAAAAAAAPGAADQTWQTSLPPRSPRPAGRRRNGPQ